MVSQITNMHSTNIFGFKISKNKEIYLNTKIQKLKFKSYSWLNNKRFTKHFWWQNINTIIVKAKYTISRRCLMQILRFLS